MSDATIDGVSEASLSLVANGDDSVETLVDGNMKEEFGDVAGSEDLVNCSEVGSALLGVEIRGEYATGNTLSSQELAGPTWASSAATAGTGSCRPAAASTRVGTHFIEKKIKKKRWDFEGRWSERGKERKRRRGFFRVWWKIVVL